MQYLSSLKLGDYFYYESDNFLEISKIEKIYRNVDTTTIFNDIDNSNTNTYYRPEKILVSKLVPNNKLSKVMYPNYVPCKEVKGYLIDKKFYEIKKELDAMS